MYVLDNRSSLGFLTYILFYGSIELEFRSGPKYRGTKSVLEPFLKWKLYLLQETCPGSSPFTVSFVIPQDILYGCP